MQLHAMPVMLGVLAILAIAYRYYSAFLAARVAVLDDRRETPAHRLYDGQNDHPTKRSCSRLVPGFRQLSATC